ncbi:MAG: PIN domain-containing protein [Solirubrobacteraceae bacterium]
MSGADRWIAAGRREAGTTPEVIQEFAHVRARRCGRADAVALGHDYAQLLSPLITITTGDLSKGLDLFEKIASLGAFDAVLAAAASGAGARALLSADASFSAVPYVAHVVPNDRAVASLLSE